MNRLRETDPRSKTGVTGISYQAAHKRRSGNRAHAFFVVRWSITPKKSGCRRFNIDTLGRHEAWRRALRLRAQHELKVGGDSVPRSA